MWRSGVSDWVWRGVGQNSEKARTREMKSSFFLRSLGGRRKGFEKIRGKKLRKSFMLDDLWELREKKQEEEGEEKEKNYGRSTIMTCKREE